MSTRRKASLIQRTCKTSLLPKHKHIIIQSGKQFEMTTFHKIVEAKRLYFLSYHNDALSEVSVTFACFLLSNSVV